MKNTPFPRRSLRTGGNLFVELYLDTSALVKLYLAEPNHEAVIDAVREAARVATSMVAYAEARAAFARRLREGTLSREEHQEVVGTFNRNWIRYDRVPVSDIVAYSAGNVAEQHALRGYDAIHLASAMTLQRHFDNLHFMAFDARLVAAARHEVEIYGIR